MGLMRPLLLLKVGRTFDEVARVHGDYDRWFRHGLGLADEPDDALSVVHVCDGAPLPTHHDFAAVVVTGSWAMVTDREPWSEASALYLRAAVERGVPVLGVCYGHQLLAHAFGGLVGYNPRGRHAGTAKVTLLDPAAGDPLFSAFESPLVVQVSHSQSVIDLPAEAVHLGTAEGDPHHVFRIGERAWGVQFHPEFSAETSRAYIRLREATIAAEGLDPDALLAGVRESADGLNLLRRFRALVG